MLAYFDQYQKANISSPLTLRGNSYLGLDRFYSDAAAGTLPQVSYIVGPAELSEHYPYLPSDGAWLQRKVVEAVVNGAAYNETVLMIRYDGISPSQRAFDLSLTRTKFRGWRVRRSRYSFPCFRRYDW
jgi:phospholipase C